MEGEGGDRVEAGEAEGWREGAWERKEGEGGDSGGNGIRPECPLLSDKVLEHR